MSIATEIQRLRTAKADIKTAIEEKGVEVGNGLIDTYAEKISEISGGGGVIPYYTFRPASPTKEVSFPCENLPSEYIVTIVPEQFPTINTEYFAFVSGFYNKAGPNSQNACTVLLRVEEGLSTSNFGFSYSNKTIRISSQHATFLPEYTYNVFVVTR